MRRQINAALLIASAVAEDAYGRMRFEDKLDYAVRVLIVGVDKGNKVYKSASVAPQKGHGFKWACGNKKRAFHLYRADDFAYENELARGTFGFYKISDGPFDCQARVYGPKAEETSWESTQVGVAFKTPDSNRGRFTFAPLSAQ